MWLVLFITLSEHCVGATSVNCTYDKLLKFLLFGDCYERINHFFYLNMDGFHSTHAYDQSGNSLTEYSST